MSSTDSTYKHTNRLIDETSPYLLQHAHNPVDWYPWGEEALAKAKAENKPLLISVGYAACHWCHVMEHESFEQEDVAELMNKYFVCIKVDREERPDIDQVYMSAVQLMTQRGGWPLNCIATPDGRPFYGGTYFPKDQWKNILEQIHNEFVSNPDKVNEYADRLTEGVADSEFITLNTSPADFTKETLEETVTNWTERFDNEEGGANRAPKFPLPNNYQFLLRYAELHYDENTLSHVETTLNKMAWGGIYDQLGGGFARYSTDIKWKVPHFEKMLYDNAQLVSLYTEAYRKFKNPLYKQTVYETIAFVERELMSANNAFYSSLDADSEGIEGKFYVWNKPELKTLLGNKFELFGKYYNVNMKGFWEHDNYILLRDESDEDFAKSQKISVQELETTINECKSILMKERDKRIRPGLDDKTLTSWNALMTKALAEAYLVFDDKHFLELAENNMTFILDKQRKKDGGLFHNHKDGKSNINGYLEDYCFTIEALITLYQASFNEKWLNTANELIEYALAHFYDEPNGMFYFTSDLDEKLVARKMEVTDNVIPASCSSMANVLFELGHLLDKPSHINKSSTMLNNIQEYIPSYGSGYSNWCNLMLKFTSPYYEVVFAGKDATTFSKEWSQSYAPNVLILGSEKDSKLPLVENKYLEGQTTIYVCENKTCQLPTTNVSDAIKQVSK